MDADKQLESNCEAKERYEASNGNVNTDNTNKMGAPEMNEGAGKFLAFWWFNLEFKNNKKKF